MLCKICNKEFSNDKSGEGKFYTHLKFEHNINKKQYVILTEFGGTAPKCVCGCGEEAAWENRIGFREYAKGHRRFKHRVQQYIKQNGYPICSFAGCPNKTGFRRAEPRKYCSLSCSIKDDPKELQRRSDFMKDRMKDLEYVNNVLSSLPQKFSKLHLKIREQLNLDKKGFIGEQVVGRYVVDELNEATKTIIEINGDYIHANPLMYAENDIIRLPNNSYTAAEKWESDKRKLDDLKSMGYNVIVIWESDNINNIEI